MDSLTDLVRKYEEAEQSSMTSRSEGEKARDYYDGRQLDEAQIKALNKRKQPIVIENLIRPKVEYLCGLERQTRTDPKAYPRTAMHEKDAEACTDALRYVADDQDIDIKRSMVFANMLIEGFGGIEVTAQRVRDGIDPKVEWIPWDRLFFDPHSSQADFSDATYLGFITWMDLTEAKKRWPGRESVLENTVSKGTSSATDTYDDKPKWAYWTDGKRKRVRIITMYCLDAGVWNRSVFTLSGELEEYGPSPFVDDEGKPECALILQSAYVDRDNDRYGIVRDYITLQDEVNKRRSKFLHLANSRQVRISRSLTADAQHIRAEMSRPDGVIVADVGEVEDISSGQMAAGHFNLLAEAKQAIQVTGPNATLQGKSGQDQSGRAILALQQGGMTEMAPLLDGLRHFNIRMFRMIWCRIRQFWNAERWVRVTDDDKNVRFVGLNVTKGAQAAMKLKQAVDAGQIDIETAKQYAMQLQSDPSMYQPANVVGEMDVDIQIDESVNTPTLQAEQFEQLTKLAPMAPPQYVPTLFAMLVEASNLRDKDKLRQLLEQMQQGPDPAQQAAMQLQLEGEKAKIEETQSKTAKNYADIQDKGVRSQIDAFKTGAQVAA